MGDKKSFASAVKKDILRIGKWFYDEAVKPAVKRAALDCWNGLTDGLRGAGAMMIYHGDTAPVESKDNGGIDYSGYSKKSDRKAEKKRGESFDIIMYTTKEQAIGVLNKMKDNIKQYRHVTIADYYEFSEAPIGPYNTNYYGWTDLSGATISVSSEGGFVINLPKAVHLSD